MTLTVRLRPELESAVVRYCIERGVTKSHVVQEALAEYLVRPSGWPKQRAESSVDRPEEPSANYLAFEAAGFIGAGRLGGRPATRDRVREAIAERMAAKRARRNT